MTTHIIYFTLFFVFILRPPVYATKFTLLTEELPPYSIRDSENGTGASIDIISHLFTRTGFDFEIIIVPWKRAIRMTLSNQYTCVFPMQRNQEREANFHWISPILISQTGFYTRKDSPLELITIDDAKGLIIGTYNGSAAAEYLTSWGYNVYTTPRDTPNIHRLMKKRIDVWAADTLSAKYLANKHKITNMKEQLVYFSTLRALACNTKVPEIKVNKLRKELKLMYTEGVIENIISKYK